MFKTVTQAASFIGARLMWLYELCGLISEIAVSEQSM